MSTKGHKTGTGRIIKDVGVTKQSAVGRLIPRKRAASSGSSFSFSRCYLLRVLPVCHAFFTPSLEAIDWTAEERGLAGLSDLEGIPWTMPMEQFFEAWVETVMRSVARQMGTYHHRWAQSVAADATRTFIAENRSTWFQPDSHSSARARGNGHIASFVAYQSF
jgi:hypothetical protein